QTHKARWRHGCGQSRSYSTGPSRRVLRAKRGPGIRWPSTSLARLRPKWNLRAAELHFDGGPSKYDHAPAYPSAIAEPQGKVLTIATCLAGAAPAAWPASA